MAGVYKVYVVVERGFGEQLAELERGVPVWIVDTHANKAVAERLWSERPAESHLTGITTFNGLPSESAEDLLLGRLDVIDLHHRPHSANPPYTVVEVFGAALSTRVKIALAEYGFDEFGEKSNGFTAIRPMPSS
jgi:hypothetical protein